VSATAGSAHGAAERADAALRAYLREHRAGWDEVAGGLEARARRAWRPRAGRLELAAVAARLEGASLRDVRAAASPAEAHSPRVRRDGLLGAAVGALAAVALLALARERRSRDASAKLGRR